MTRRPDGIARCPGRSTPQVLTLKPPRADKVSLHLCVAPEMLSLVAASGYVLNAPAPIASRVRAVSMDAAKMECAAASRYSLPRRSCIPTARGAYPR